MSRNRLLSRAHERGGGGVGGRDTVSQKNGWPTQANGLGVKG